MHLDNTPSHPNRRRSRETIIHSMGWIDSRDHAEGIRIYLEYITIVEEKRPEWKLWIRALIIDHPLGTSPDHVHRVARVTNMLKLSSFLLQCYKSTEAKKATSIEHWSWNQKECPEWHTHMYLQAEHSAVLRLPCPSNGNNIGYFYEHLLYFIQIYHEIRCFGQIRTSIEEFAI